jgi:tetratricopeptide (TPR) repeat protein/TolB-like protein
MKSGWLRKPASDACIVFVHGILSSGETCWRHDNATYWPDLVRFEPHLVAVGIYVFTYETGLFSGSYSLGDVVDSLKEQLRLDNVLECKHIIFVCHSMGGIVVRRFIVQRALELEKANIEVGLFLVASPSLGSSYADWLSPLAKLFGHSQADALRFVRHNEWLGDLDKDFLNLYASRTLHLAGKELVEDKFVYLKGLFLHQVVEPFSGSKYFGEPYKVPASNHFTIAKPGDKNAIQHRLLVRFVEDFLRTSEQRPQVPDFFKQLIDAAADFDPTHEGSSSSLKPVPNLKSWRGAWKRVLYGALALLGLGLAIIGFIQLPVQAGARRSIAVLGFKEISENTRLPWISTALSDSLAARLGQAGSVRVISQEDVEHMKLDLGFLNSDKLSPELLLAARRHLGADFVVVGSYLASDSAIPEVRINCVVQDAATGETVLTWTDVARESNLEDLADRGTQTLLRRLDLQRLPKVMKGHILPSTTEALQNYALGMDELRHFNALRGSELLTRSIASDPQNPSSHAALASALATLGYDGRAKDEAKTALQLSVGLDNEHQLVARGRYSEFSYDWSGAINAYKALTAMFPDNVDYLIQLADIQISDSDPESALKTLDNLQHLPAASRTDPRIDLERAKANEKLADFSKMLQSAEVAIVKGNNQGERFVVANALNAKGVALWRLGNPMDGEQALRDAKSKYASGGDSNGVATTELGLAKIARGQGDFPGASEQFQRALLVYTKSGNRRGVGEALNGLGLIKKDHGDLSGATVMFRQVLESAKETSNKALEAAALGNLGQVANDQGDLSTAEQYHEGAISGYREIGDTFHLANELNALAAVYFDEGELDDALKMQDEGLPKARESHSRVTEAYILSARGEVVAEMGDLQIARDNHQSALKIWNDLGRDLDSNYDSVFLAAISIEEGAAASSEPILRNAVSVFERAEQREYTLIAQKFLMQALLKEGKLKEAQLVALEASKLAAGSQLGIIRLDTLAQVALVEGEAGQPTRALRELKVIADSAQKSGYAKVELEARLAIGLVEKKINAGTGNAYLTFVAQDAKERGFHLIQRKATASLS